MHNKEIIVVMGGGIIKDKDGKWHSDSDKTTDVFGKTNNGLWRVEASKYLFKNAGEQVIVASGGKGQYRYLPDFPTVASVIKSELVGLGVPPESVIEEKSSNNTIEQLEQVAKIIDEYKPKKVLIISNEWHLPRIGAFIKKDSILATTFNNIDSFLISAEDVLIEYDNQKWLKRISADRDSKKYKERKQLEEKGFRDIENGVYKGVDCVKY